MKEGELMEDAEKLLEAARMIQEHCSHTEKGGFCPFAYGGICNGVEHCRLSIEGGLNPGIDWDLQNACRWTDADIAMAKAMKSAGFDMLSAYCSNGEPFLKVYVETETGFQWGIPPGVFKSIKPDEVVQLSDIIAEGADQ